MRIVKKYGNRRLYDTTDSSYVTLAEVAAKALLDRDGLFVSPSLISWLCSAHSSPIIIADCSCKASPQELGLLQQTIQPVRAQAARITQER